MTFLIIFPSCAEIKNAKVNIDNASYIYEYNLGLFVNCSFASIEKKTFHAYSLKY